MTDPAIRDLRFQIYFDAAEVDRAKSVAEAARKAFALPVGHFRLGPVGPHPRRAVQLTVRPDQFGEVAPWFALNRTGLTVFAHASTGNHLAGLTEHLIWFGPSKSLDLEVLRGL